MFVNYIVHDVLECEQEVPGRRGTDTETNRGSSAPSSSLANNTYIVFKIVHELLKNKFSIKSILIWSFNVSILAASAPLRACVPFSTFKEI